MPQLRDISRIPNNKDVLRYSRLRWFGHIESMPNDNWPKKVMDFQIPGANIRGAQKKKRIHNVKEDLGSLKLKTCIRQNREEWRRAIRPFQQQITVQPPTTGNQGH